jgi:hypothetical protein
VLPGFWLKAEWFWQEPLPRPQDALMEIAPEAFLRDIQEAYERQRRTA